MISKKTINGSTTNKKHLKLSLAVFYLVFFLSFGNQLLAQSGKVNFDSLTAGSIISQSILAWPKDFAQIAKAPSTNWKKTGLVVGSTLALIATDKPSQRFIQNTINPIFDWNLQPIPFIRRVNVGNRALFGGETNGYLLVGLSAQYVGSIIFNYKRGQVSTVLAGKSMVTSYVVSHIFLKSVFARKRPLDPIDGPISTTGMPRGFTQSTLDFGNYEWPTLQNTRSGASFPSFHFTMYFAVARTIHRTYDNPWLAYSILAAGLLPDFGGHRHWLSDMFIGGVIGTVIGEVTYRSFIKKALDIESTAQNNASNFQKLANHTSIEPRISPQYTGISLTYHIY